MKIVFWVSMFLIFHAFIGYPLSLIILNKFLKVNKFKYR